MAKGLRVKDLIVGTGDIAGPASLVTVAYSLALNHGEPIRSDQSTFSLKRRQVIAGLRYGIRGMAVGGKRMLRISPHLAYGSEGVPGLIPPDALLVVEVELLSCSDDSSRD